jgi:hypothetical protein
MRRSSSTESDSGITVTTTTVATTPTATASATVDPDDLPDPTADYKSIDDAKLDGNKAIGKTIFLRVWRGATDATTVTLYGCGKLAGGFLNATYSVEKRALVKAIATTIPLQGHCPRVVIKLTGKQPYSNDFKGELQQIMDVTAADPETLPSGVDYVSMDDINIDGKKAMNKVAQLRAYRNDLEEKKFTAYPCGHSGGLSFMYVSFSATQKDVVKDFSDSPMSCQTMKVKLVSQSPYSNVWNAQLIEVVKD